MAGLVLDCGVCASRSRGASIELITGRVRVLVAFQIEEAKADECRIALVFASQGLPLSLGNDVLNRIETRYDIIFASVEEKAKFVVEVGLLLAARSLGACDELCVLLFAP